MAYVSHEIVTARLGSDALGFHGQCSSNSKIADLRFIDDSGEDGFCVMTRMPSEELRFW